MEALHHKADTAIILCMQRVACFLLGVFCSALYMYKLKQVYHNTLKEGNTMLLDHSLYMYMHNKINILE